jgi:DNA-binding CsgD family transcriptional regulator
LQDYAGQNGISPHTAKTHLKQIFQKTGHGRQTDLLRDIMANPVLRIRV